MVIFNQFKQAVVSLCFIMIASLFTQVVYGNLSVKLERETMYIDQTVRLIVESDDLNNNNQPDLSELNQKFKVLGTSSSQNVSIINGKQTSLKRWIIELEPREVGSFTVPPIWLGNEKSEAQRVTVLPQDPLKSKESRDIFVEMAADSTKAYVQQQVNLVIRLYLGINIVDGTLSEPEPNDTDVRRIGTDIQYETTIGNREYRVIERKYALFPRLSGQLDIPAVLFQGVAEDTSSSGNQIFNSLFNQGTRVRAKSEPMKLDILPPNPDFTGNTWLPAKNLEISDLSGVFGEIQVGQPITRQIQIRAVGLTAEQLPDIEFLDSPDLKQYPDKTARESQQDGNNIIGRINRSIAIIPTREGMVTLPEISINWWNTVTNKMETTVLPEQTLTVIANPAAKRSVKPEPIPDTTSLNGSEDRRLLQPTKPIENNFWKWLSIICFIGWALTSVFYWRSIRGSKTSSGVIEKTNQINETNNVLLSKLKQACKDGNPSEARTLLKSWAKNIWPNLPALTLEEIANRLNSRDLTKEFLRLDQCLYSEFSGDNSESKKAWPGTELLKLLSILHEANSDNLSQSKQILPILYPTEN